MKNAIISCAIICNDGNYLIAQRKDNAKWEFVSGQLTALGMARNSLQKQLEYEFNIICKNIQEAQPYTFVDSDTVWTVVPFIVQAASQRFTLYSEKYSDLKWVDKSELAKYASSFVVETPY